MNSFFLKMLVIIILCGASQILMGQSETKVKTFTVTRDGNLTVKIDAGDISISTNNGNEIKIKYEYDEWNEEPLKIIQSGNNITVSSGSWGGEDVVISAPSNFNFDLKTSAGDIEIQGSVVGRINCNSYGGDIKLKNVEGEVKVNTGGGDIETGDIKGSIDLNSAGGDIKAGKIDGSVKINTAGGNISVASCNNKLWINTAGGNISVGNVNGEATINTAGGNIKVGNVLKATSLNTAGGNIYLEKASGEVKVSSGGGNIKLNSISGKLKASTGSGDIEVKLLSNLSGDVEIKTGYGNITLYVPDNLKAKINTFVKLRGWGSEQFSDYIKSDFKVSSTNNFNEDKEIRAEYILNGGGRNINLQTSSGEIRILKDK